eukprot:c3720_g1_i2.p2 GENE.c3720_g1_i2~~c3720_g1_i2.p2  ORF type:complete len:117 (+),score=15.54 c3720_g1_i2:278-628(+)
MLSCPASTSPSPPRTAGAMASRKLCSSTATGFCFAGRLASTRGGGESSASSSSSSFGWKCLLLRVEWLVLAAVDLLRVLGRDGARGVVVGAFDLDFVDDRRFFAGGSSITKFALAS